MPEIFRTVELDVDAMPRCRSSTITLLCEHMRELRMPHGRWALVERRCSVPDTPCVNNEAFINRLEEESHA